MALLGKGAWRGSTQKWGAATEGRVVAPKPRQCAGQSPSLQAHTDHERLWPGVLAQSQEPAQTLSPGESCASLAVYCPFPRPPAAAQVCRQSRLPIFTPPSVLLPSCPSQGTPAGCLTPHPLSSQGKKGERTGTESGAATDGCWCGAGMRDRWFSRHSGDRIRPSCRMSASIAASALMLWAGERQKPRCTSVPSAGILSPLNPEGLQGRGAYQAGQRTAPQEKLGMQARVGTGASPLQLLPGSSGHPDPKRC